MIEFKGELSAETKQFIKTELRRIYVIVCVALIIGVLVAATIITAIKRGGIFALFYACAVIPLIGVFVCKPSEKDCKSITPLIVTIKDNGEITSEGEKFYFIRTVRQTRKVIDYGSLYYFVFKSPFGCNAFICQKDLITQDAIEEFEKIFDGKIVRKVSNEAK